MLIGAHVSPAGGPAKAVERGEERGCASIQIFNQNPRAWRPTVYSDEQVAAFREALDASKRVQELVIHAVYLLNCASEDEEIRRKSLDSLVGSLRAGAALGAVSVVLHPGSALTERSRRRSGDERAARGRSGGVEAALDRAAKTIAEALGESEDCRLDLENTAGAGGTLGRTFDELAAMIEAAGGDGRLGVCLDSCHLFASGYDIRDAAGLDRVLEEFDRVVGLDRLGTLHVNDSMTPLGSNRDRHAPLGDGELGAKGCAAFLSEPRFEGLPCIFEGPGVGGKQVEPEDIEIATKLRRRGRRSRSRRR